MNDSPAVAPNRFDQCKTMTYNVLALVLCIFVLFAVNSTLFAEQSALALFGMFGLVLVFLSQPLIKRRGDWTLFRVIDGLLIVATIVTFGYIFVQSEPMLSWAWVEGTLLGDRAGNETSLDFAIAGSGLLLVLEATRRAIGWTLPILCCIFIAYAFYGPDLPDALFPHRGFSWQQVAQKTFLQSTGVFGIAMKVMFMYVFLFVLFGTLLEQTGATGYVIRFARGLFRNSSGGPAKVAVVTSGLMGSLSGSAVANTATTGTFTIPLMKSSGFNSESAAGVEAAASSGGALMPPVMGAGAYMMLEMVQPAVTYVEIIKAALIPAVLYYTALLLTVHLHAKKIGAAAESDLERSGDTSTADPDASGEKSVSATDSDPNGPSMAPSQGVVFFGSFVILILMLVWGFTPFFSVSVSLAGIVALSMLSEPTRLTPWKFFQATIGAARGGMALIVAASCVGIILGIVSQTGLGGVLPTTIQSFASDSALLALLLLMVSTIILGMGLPSAVCYLLMAILVGGVLKSLETPPLAAHLFIFYFGMMSMVTPPVALAAYAAAAIARAHVIKSAFAAFRFALVGFALPFAFVLRPQLLMLTPDGSPADWWMIAAHVATTLVGILGLAGGIAGYVAGQLKLWVRFVLLLASVAVFFTNWNGVEFIIHMSSVGLVVALLVFSSSSEPGNRWVKA
ncbi:MAG: TRAP transporter fused permease subunit [Fuerstiella sp.]